MLNSATLTATSSPKKPIFNPFLPDFHQNPYSTYHQLRTEDPVHRSFMGVWVLTRYADVKAILRDPRFACDNLPARVAEKARYLQQGSEDFEALTQASSKFFFFLNPPDHTRLRTLVGKAFSTTVVEQMRPQVQTIVNRLLDAVQAKGGMDIIRDLACPLPVLVIGTMLGVPSEAQSKLHEWSGELARLLDPLMSLDTYRSLSQVAGEFKTYFSELIRERQAAPQDDLISHLIAVREQTDKLSEAELISICMLLFATGEETTVNLIGNGLLALLQHPEQMQQLRQNPNLIQTAVEELLRYDCPVQLTARTALQDVEIGGKLIKAGDRVVAYFGAANHDPAEFSAPDQLDLSRRENRHLAFGDGMHYCLGAALARVQGQIAINTLLQRFNHLQLQTEALEWRGNIVLRGLKALPVTFS